MTTRYRIMAYPQPGFMVEPDDGLYDLTTAKGAAGALLDHCQAWDPKTVAVSVRHDGGSALDATREVSILAVERAMLDHEMAFGQIPAAILVDVEAESLAIQLDEVEEAPEDLRSSSPVGMFS